MCLECAKMMLFTVVLSRQALSSAQLEYNYDPEKIEDICCSLGGRLACA